MPDLNRILRNKKFKATAHDLEMEIRRFLDKRGFIVERWDKDETKNHFYLDFKQRIFSVHVEPMELVWGVVEVIAWSDGTEIVGMWPRGPHEWKDRRPAIQEEERTTCLEALSDALLERFEALEVSAIENSAAQVSAVKPKKAEQKRGKQLRIEYSLAALRKLRSEAIQSNRPIPTKAFAMSHAVITDKTWKTYDKELWARWDDRSYRQEKQE